MAAAWAFPLLLACWPGEFGPLRALGVREARFEGGGLGVCGVLVLRLEGSGWAVRSPKLVARCILIWCYISGLIIVLGMAFDLARPAAGRVNKLAPDNSASTRADWLFFILCASGVCSAGCKVVSAGRSISRKAGSSRMASTGGCTQMLPAPAASHLVRRVLLFEQPKSRVLGR